LFLAFHSKVIIEIAITVTYYGMNPSRKLTEKLRLVFEFKDCRQTTWQFGSSTSQIDKSLGSLLDRFV